ncbi:MAG: hypothetical protein ACOYN4_10670 [Bacteroidales bacterium]|jgi:hypothetical protein
MKSFILGSKPLIELNQKCLEIAAVSLMMARCFSLEAEEISVFDKELKLINELIDHSKAVLKNLDDDN